MKIEELASYKFATSFTTSSLDICSPNNDFTALLKTGVNVLGLRPRFPEKKGVNVSVEQTLINTPHKLPLSDIPINYELLDREQFCILTLDSKISQNAGKHLETSGSYVRRIDWGYLFTPTTQKSVIGVLTNYGCLKLYVSNIFEWNSVADISVIWKNHGMKESMKSDYRGDFESYSKMCKFCKFVAFSWCNGFEAENDCESLLLAVSESGAFSFWKINGNDPVVQVNLVKFIELPVQIDSIYWKSVSKEESLVVFSCVDGTIDLYSCSRNPSSNEIELIFLQTLWSELDYVLPRNLKIRCDPNKKTLILSKEHCLLVFQLEPVTCVHVHEFHRKVAGIEFMDDYRILVTLNSFESFLIQIENNSNERVSVPYDVRRNTKSHRCTGVSFSRNKVFAVFSMSVAKFYDHLALKDNSHSLLCSMGIEITLTDLLSFVIKNFVHEGFDLIEGFRIQLTNKDELIKKHELSVVWNYLDDEEEVCGRVLKLMFLLVSGFQLSENKEDKFIIETLLLLSNFRTYCMRKNEVNIRQRSLYHSWLRLNLPKLPKTFKQYKLIQEVSQELQNAKYEDWKEKCELCSDTIKTHSSWKYLECSNNHKTLRCTYSFIPISLDSYKECLLCHSIVKEINALRRCVICDSLFW